MGLIIDNTAVWEDQIAPGTEILSCPTVFTTNGIYDSNGAVAAPRFTTNGIDVVELPLHLSFKTSKLPNGLEVKWQKVYRHLAWGELADQISESVNGFFSDPISANNSVKLSKLGQSAVILSVNSGNRVNLEVSLVDSLVSFKSSWLDSSTFYSDTSTQIMGPPSIGYKEQDFIIIDSITAY